MKYTRTYLILIFLCFIPFLGNSQELNCNVEINTTQIQGSDKSIFTKLQSAVFEFVNNRKWTNNVFENHLKFLTEWVR